jgi:hypothetical protein
MSAKVEISKYEALEHAHWLIKAELDVAYHNYKDVKSEAYMAAYLRAEGMEEAMSKILDEAKS